MTSIHDLLPRELVAAVASHMGPSDLAQACAADPKLLLACNSEAVQWRAAAPEIEPVLPPRVSARQLLSPLDIAWYRSALDALCRKCALYAIMVRVNEARSFSSFMDAIMASATDAVDEHTHFARISSKIDTIVNERDHVSFVGNLSDLEAWARRQPSLAGFDLCRDQREGDAPVEIVGPLGPHAEFVSRPPALFAVKDNIHAFGWGDILSAARNPHFIAEARTRVNRALAKAFDRHTGPRQGRRAEWTATMEQATLLNRETPDTRNGKRPLDMRTKITAFVDCIDLWRAYPDAQVYLVKTGGLWAAGLALPL
ncbi:hypothetical protein pneo_cds_754 [Pandoravirus neocaledonia]|uniref:DUF5902 domain-containing protein n=1 Tax=Pandoravirus neocaledonia TaxID=2107708 RepID=A0A2U7UD19_9VIRU|nr:hypothetical protein pneo_cds_754 [Pandoravirus neocaledonia]AVK76361.1 hypothetical protein pneo_cds_754 [Pandoravirus neocaledonia]